MRRVAHLELRMALRDGSLRWTAGAIVVLILFAAFNGWAWREHRSTAIEAAVAEAGERGATWLEDLRLYLDGNLNPGYEPPDDPYFVYAFFPHYAVAAPGPLSVLSVGQSDLYMSYAAGNMIESNLLYHDDEIQNPALLALGRFDIAFLLAVVLPVLIIALMYDLVGQDRQLGRDRLLGVQAGSISRIVGLRALLRGLWIGAATTLPLAAVLVAAGALQGSGVAATLLVLVLVLAYCLFWAALALAVNARGASPMRNAVILLAVWGLTALFAPAAADRIARAAHPLEPGALRPAQERALLQSISDSAAIARLATYETLQLGLSPDVDRQTRWVAGAELRRDTAAALAAQERGVIRARQELADLFAVLPPLAVHRALQRVAGSDTHAMLTFQDALAAARRERAAVARSNPLRGEPAQLQQVEHLAETMILRHDPAAASLGMLAGSAGLLLLLSTALALIGLQLMRGPAEEAK